LNDKNTRLPAPPCCVKELIELRDLAGVREKFAVVSGFYGKSAVRVGIVDATRFCMAWARACSRGAAEAGGRNEEWRNGPGFAAKTLPAGARLCPDAADGSAVVPSTNDTAATDTVGRRRSGNAGPPANCLGGAEPVGKLYDQLGAVRWIVEP
jgi:hypothetical protein